MKDHEQHKDGKWEFNAQVAEQFDSIAHREIPDYQRVIELSIALIGKSDLSQPKIIDVGSATGYTLKCLYDSGYRSLYGVDSSADMLSRSFQQATLIESNFFPGEHAPFDFVLANWVLHFIPERRDYLAAIKQSLAKNGTLILTEKLQCSDRVHDLYHDFKRCNGISEEEIRSKQQRLQGVLIPHPLSWYLDTLNELGFEQVEIINAHTAFVTFIAVVS